ncbi:aminotransferase class IV [Legionella tunisiensis]|uniref:aminotransferase class IV n=1 Tax=Legionella tunisiensis TaxID=1034944 RepID=UPI0002FC0905|nr:aminotransferase class IV [Legionella tunisiensis]
MDTLCLPGITRHITIDLIKSLSLPLREEKIPTESIFNAQEVWITSTTKEIYPITRINDCIIGKGCGGMYWQQLNEKYQQLIKNTHE